jgi:hypothetical protein
MYENAPVLVAGLHRLTALRELGHEMADCFVSDFATEEEAGIWEIDENLMRAELSAAQEADCMARRKVLWERRDSALSAKIWPKPQGRPDGFAADVEAKTGRSKSGTNQAIARAKALGDDIKKVAGTSLDKGVELDALAKMPEPERKELVERASHGEQVTARRPVPIAADPLNDLEALEKQVAALMAAWNRASKPAREEFLLRIDRPVFDSTEAA